MLKILMNLRSLYSIVTSVDRADVSFFIQHLKSQHSFSFSLYITTPFSYFNLYQHWSFLSMPFPLPMLSPELSLHVFLQVFIAD